MTARKDMEAVVEAARRQGWRVETTRGGHWRLYSPDGRDIVHAAGAPGSARSAQKTVSKLRQYNGFEWKGRQPVIHDVELILAAQRRDAELGEELLEAFLAAAPGPPGAGNAEARPEPGLAPSRRSNWGDHGAQHRLVGQTRASGELRGAVRRGSLSRTRNVTFSSPRSIPPMSIPRAAARSAHTTDVEDCAAARLRRL